MPAPSPCRPATGHIRRGACKARPFITSVQGWPSFKLSGSSGELVFHVRRFGRHSACRCLRTSSFDCTLPGDAGTQASLCKTRLA